MGENSAKKVLSMNAGNLEELQTNNDSTKSLYEKNVADVRNAIDNMRLAGINVSKYEEELTKIRNRVINDIKQISSNRNNVHGYLKSAVYDSAIQKLDKIKGEILAYDAYIVAYNSCLKIQNIINNSNSDVSINDLVAETIRNLINLSQNCEKIGNDMFLKIYEMVYGLIKFEIMKTGNSVLYENIKANDVNKRYLSMIIERQVERYKNNQEIQNRLYAIKSTGVFSDYIDLGLIKLIMVNADKEFKKHISQMLGSKFSLMESADNKVKKMARYVDSQTRNVNESVSEIKSDKKKANRRARALGLTLALIISGGVGIERLVRHFNIDDAYDVTTTTVSMDGNIRNTENTIGYGSVDVVATEEVKTYADGHVEKINTEYKYRGREVNKNNYNDTLIGLYIIYVFLLTFFTLMDVGPFGISNYQDLFILYRYIKHDKKIAKERIDKLIELLSEFKELLTENAAVRKEFVTLYEENKYLLDDEDELVKRVSAYFDDDTTVKSLSELLDSDDFINVKKLIK